MTDKARHAISMIRHQLERIEKVFVASEESPTRIAVARPMADQVKANANNLAAAIQEVFEDHVLLFRKCWADTVNEDCTGDDA